MRTFYRFAGLEGRIELAVQVDELTEDQAFRGKGSLRDQLERASGSISNNIAESFKRGATQVLITFLYIARGCDAGPTAFKIPTSKASDI